MTSVQLTILSTCSHSWLKNADSFMPIRALKTCATLFKAIFYGYSVSINSSETCYLLDLHPKSWFANEIKPLLQLHLNSTSVTVRPLMTPQAQPEKNKQLYMKVGEYLRRDVLKLFGIRETKYRRGFPQCSTSDTCCPWQPDKQKVDKLLGRLRLYARALGLGTKSKTYDDKVEETQICFHSSLDENIKALRQLIKLIYPELQHLDFSGVHGYPLSYEDKAILRVFPPDPSKSKRINGVNTKYTENNKPIIMQGSIRGCTAAVTAMLICEYTNEFFLFNKLRHRNLGTDKAMMKDIESAGLMPLTTRCESSDDLAQAIKKNGAAIVFVDSGCGSHVILVDHVADEYVRIRDPCHGWEIDLHKQDFEQSWWEEGGGRSIIQVQAVPHRHRSRMRFIDNKQKKKREHDKID